jgi:hypothetical protein
MAESAFRHSSQLKEQVVGTTGFEPATSRTPSVRATRLRHVPTVNAGWANSPRRISNGVFSLSLAFQKRQECPQRIAQVEQDFSADT